MMQDDIETQVPCPAHREGQLAARGCAWCGGARMVSVEQRTRFKLGLPPPSTDPPPEAA